MIIEVFVGATIAALFVPLNEIRRVTILHNTLMNRLNEGHEKRMDIISNFKGNSYDDLQRAVDAIPYPDVHASYANLKWYKFWESPRNLVVMEK